MIGLQGDVISPNEISSGTQVLTQPKVLGVVTGYF